MLLCCGVSPVGSVCLARMAAALVPIVVDAQKMQVSFPHTTHQQC